MVVSGVGSVQSLGDRGGQGCGPSIRFIVGVSDTGRLDNYRHVVCSAVTWCQATFPEVLRDEGLVRCVLKAWYDGGGRPLAKNS